MNLPKQQCQRGGVADCIQHAEDAEPICRHGRAGELVDDQIEHHGHAREQKLNGWINVHTLRTEQDPEHIFCGGTILKHNAVFADVDKSAVVYRARNGGSPHHAGKIAVVRQANLPAGKQNAERQQQRGRTEQIWLYPVEFLDKSRSLQDDSSYWLRFFKDCGQLRAAFPRPPGALPRR